MSMASSFGVRCTIAMAIARCLSQQSTSSRRPIRDRQASVSRSYTQGVGPRHTAPARRARDLAELLEWGCTACPGTPRPKSPRGRPSSQDRRPANVLSSERARCSNSSDSGSRCIGGAALAAVLALTGTRAALASTRDAWITTRAKMALLATEGLRGGTIDVDTVNGRITLHGRVRTADEKAKAEDAVRTVDGVKDVRNILQVVGGQRERLVRRADAEIRDEVEKALGTDRALAGSRIAVRSVNDGVVLLAGRASTMSEHLRAMGDAARVPGVRRVASEIESPKELTDAEIGRASGPLAREDRGMSDAARDLLITSATKLRLLADRRTPALDINVDTVDGDLTLFGMVPSNEAKAAAEEDARRVRGVKRVVNMLQVVHPAKQEAVKATDQALERDIKAALASRPDLSDSRIAVEVKNGVARLSGTVPSQDERLAAAITARSAVGVKWVRDDLRVSVRTDSHPLAPVPDGVR